MQPFPPSDHPVLVQWLVDTRPLWPEATETRQLAVVAKRALAVLLSDAERASVLRYVHVRDAKMALASQLLKHFVVARCRIPWSATPVARDPPPHGKPAFRDATTRRAPVAFNVSHQAGMVALVGVYGGDVQDDDPGRLFEVGVDLVAPAERRARDHQMVAEEDDGTASPATGWARFVDMHAEVLAADEVAALKSAPPRPLDARLRRFYALWCLREAYVKMTGEALLAPWLKDLVFRAYGVPGVAAGATAEATGKETDAVVSFRGQPVVDVNLRLAALAPSTAGDDYMVCTAVRSPRRPAAALALQIGAFEALDMDAVVAFAERYWE